MRWLIFWHLILSSNYKETRQKIAVELAFFYALYLPIDPEYLDIFFSS